MIQTQQLTTGPGQAASWASELHTESPPNARKATQVHRNPQNPYYLLLWSLDQAPLQANAWVQLRGYDRLRTSPISWAEVAQTWLLTGHSPSTLQQQQQLINPDTSHTFMSWNLSFTVWEQLSDGLPPIFRHFELRETTPNQKQTTHRIKWWLKATCAPAAI